MAEPQQRTRQVEPLWREVVGDVLRRERRESELRLVDVARRAGVSPQYLSEVERGRKDASSELLSAIAGALDLTVVEVASRAASGARIPVSGGRDAFCLAA